MIRELGGRGGVCGHSRFVRACPCASTPPRLDAPPHFTTTTQQQQRYKPELVVCCDAPRAITRPCSMHGAWCPPQRLLWSVPEKS